MNTNEPESDEEDSEAAKLAWEYVNKRRLGKNPSIGSYRDQLTTTAEKEEFDLLVAMDELCELSVEVEVRKINESN